MRAKSHADAPFLARKPRFQARENRNHREKTPKRRSKIRASRLRKRAHGSPKRKARSKNQNVALKKRNAPSKFPARAEQKINL